MLRGSPSHTGERTQHTRRFPVIEVMEKLTKTKRRSSGGLVLGRQPPRRPATCCPSPGSLNSRTPQGAFFVWWAARGQAVGRRSLLDDDRVLSRNGNELVVYANAWLVRIYLSQTWVTWASWAHLGAQFFCQAPAILREAAQLSRVSGGGTFRLLAPFVLVGEGVC